MPWCKVWMYMNWVCVCCKFCIYINPVKFKIYDDPTIGQWATEKGEARLSEWCKPMQSLNVHNHWNSLNIIFICIYIGYMPLLGNIVLKLKLSGLYRYTYNQHCIQNSPIPCNIGIKTHAVITWNDHIMYNVCIFKFVALTSSQYKFTLHAYFSSATYLWFLQIRLCLKKKKRRKRWYIFKE